MGQKPLDAMLRNVRRLAAVQTNRELSDRELVERFVTRKEEAAFAVLVERHGRMVHGVCWRALGNVHDAEDACQASFLVLAQTAPSVRKAASLASWLHGVALRVASNLRRQRSRRARRERASRPPTVADPAAEVSWAEAWAALDEELGRLPECLRAPLVLCYLDGRTRDEAARQLGLTVGSLRGRLERGRKALCERLTRRGITLGATLLAAAVGEGVSRAGLSPTATLSTTKAAVVIASGRAPDGGLVAGGVLSLAKEVLRTMTLTKAKVAAALFTGLLLLGLGGALIWRGAAPDRSPAAAPDETRTAAEEAQGLAGDWRLVEAERGGKKLPSYEARGYGTAFTFTAEGVTSRNWLGEEFVGRHQFTLDPARSPKTIDISVDVPKTGARVPVLGIYSVEGDRLRLCLAMSPDGGAKRPTEFATRDGDGQQFLLLARVSPREAGSPAQAGELAADELGAILGEWRQAKRAQDKAARGAKTSQERQKAEAETAPPLKSLAERCLKVALAHPDAPAALAALLWAVSNVPDSPAGQKALAVLQAGRIARAGLDELGDALGTGPADWRTTSAMTSETAQKLAPLVLERVKKDLDHARAATLLTWVCTAFLDDESPEAPRAFAEAADLIAARFAASPDVEHLPECLGIIRHPRWADKYEKHLRTILTATPHAHVRFSAHFALATVLARGAAGRKEEARQLYEQFVKDYAGRDQGDGWDHLVKELISRARDEIDELLVRRVGQTAPDIEGEDLDGRPMKLADYRGKVVLLSFWASWCGPCMRLVPHERALQQRLAGKDFALVGVNGDSRPEELRQALEKNPVTWRSFKSKREGKPSIAQEWKVLGWPTLYLIDRDGVIRKRWVGAPPPDELDREVDQLVGVAPRTGFLDRVYKGPAGEARYAVFLPHGYDDRKAFPAILFLHGSGQSGADGRRPTEIGLGPAIRKREKEFGFIAVFPQSREGGWEANSEDGRRALAILDEVESTYQVDKKREYLTGVSMGGAGVWSLAAACPGRWAAIVPVCGGGDAETAARIKDIPCWCFHGDDDRVVPVRGSRRIVKAMQEAGGRPLYHEYPGVGHNCWDRVYATPELYEWLLGQKRK
jgi:RNA polymerase sigma factor (sigma-70 family)